MSKSSILTVAVLLALAIWLLSFGLFLELSQHDPYSWAFPGRESDLSRSLFLARRALYVQIGIASFVVGCALGLLNVLVERRLRRSTATS